MWILNVITEMLGRALPVLFAVVLLVGAYGYLSNEEYEDEFSVTFTFSCTSVINVPGRYPPEVVEECGKLDVERRKR
jgi:hypothetical protein